MDDLQVRLAQALAHRYRVEHELGRGGMSIVYLAWDQRHERYVALKVLRPELSATLGPERFGDEIKTLARLKHPFILKLHDSGEADGLLYYVMPHVEGESLRQRLLSGRRLPVAEAARITQEVAEALDYAHRHDRIHRDIKPENILFEEGHAIVSDFGIALAISQAGATGRRTGTDTVLGTVDYMSPEQEQKLELDGRTDIYSLGLVLYEMLTGELPGPDRGVDSLTGRRPDVPVEMVGLLRRMLARDPAQRFPDSKELVDALAAFTGRASWDDVARRRKWVMGGASALVAGAAVVFLLGSRPPKAEPPDPTHVAVLYFEDLSAGGKLGHVATGLTNDLIEALSRVPTLRVISPDGVKPFRGHTRPLDSIAHQLQVGTLVTGSVAESRHRLRVAVRLVDPISGAQLASETFERPQGELFALQDTITAEVSDALRRRLGSAIEVRRARAGTTSPAAWQTFQRASELRDEAPLLATDDPAAAARLYLRADSLAALAERADRHWSEPVLLRGWLAYDLSGVPMLGNPTIGSAAGLTTLDWLTRGREQAERALEILTGDPRALTLRGTIEFRQWFVEGSLDSTSSKKRLANAERDLRAAVAIVHREQAQAWGTLSQLLQLQGRVEQAYFAAQRAYETDAYLFNSDAIVYLLFHTSFQLGRDGEAVRWCDTGRHRYPQNWLFLHCRLTLLGSSKEVRPSVDEAWRTVRAVQATAPVQHRVWVEPRLRMLAAVVIARAGIRDSADHVIRAARGLAPSDPELLYLEALARIRLHQQDSAVALLTANLSSSPDARAFLRRDRQLTALADQPAFKRLVGDARP